MSKKINVYKTVKKVVENNDFCAKQVAIASICGDSFDYIFDEENEHLLDDCESEEFKRIIDEALNDEGIYLSLIMGYDEHDYGIVIDKDLDTRFIKRCYGDFVTGEFFEEVLDGISVDGLIGMIMKTIIYD